MSLVRMRDARGGFEARPCMRFCVLLAALFVCNPLNGYVNNYYYERSWNKQTLILTIDSTPIYWPEFHFWLNYIKKHYRKHHNLEKIIDWDVKQNGMYLREFFLSTAVDYASKDRAIEAKARELGIGLSSDDLAEMERKRQSNIKIYGSEQEYLRIISKMYVSEEVFNYLTKIDYLSKYIFKHFYGANGEKCSDEDITAYIKENGYMCAKYIFLSNIDSDRNELTIEKRAKNHKLLEEIINRLNTSDFPVNLFDMLMNKYGEDPDILKYPDGRLFTPGSMDKEFESAYLKLSENKYSGIVRTGHGCYIILRMPISPDMKADSAGNTLRYWTAYDYFKKSIREWSAKMKIEYKDAYYKIDVEGLPDN